MSSLSPDVSEEELPALSDLPAYVALYAGVEADREALRGEDETLGYGAADARLQQYATALRRLGLDSQSVVAVLGYSRPECLLLFLACCQTGAIFLGLNPKYTSRELALVCDDARPRALFVMNASTDDEQAEKLRRLCPSLASVEHVVCRCRLSGIDGLELSELLGGAEMGVREPPAPDPNLPCALVYTSGSTGIPKGALLSQAGLIRSAILTWKYWYGGLSAIRTVVQHPIDHVSWLTCECVTPLIAGGTLVFRERFDGPGTLRLIESERINLWFTFPAMVAITMQTEEFVTRDLSSLEVIAFGSSPSPQIIDSLRSRTRAVMSTSYGLTEASGGAVTATSGRDDPILVATSVGRMVPGLEFKLMDEEGRDTTSGGTGELLVRDECVFLGYLNRPADTAGAVDEEGRLHTADVVSIDSTGIVRLIGRTWEMFKSGGYNVYPSEVEQVLCGPGVTIAAVVDAADPVWGQVGVAFVAVADGESFERRSFDNFLRERLANYKVPKRLEIRSALPQLENGKVDRKALREEAKGFMTARSNCREAL